MQSAAYGVAKNVLKVSWVKRKNKSQNASRLFSAPIGALHKSTLFIAKKMDAKIICPSRLPNILLLVLSDKKPTSGSEIPSQSEVIAIITPTSAPESPITLVAKNIIKEETVCPVAP